QESESNILFGEGGAGAFSDGKLRTRIGNPLVWTFLNALVASGAPETLLWDAKPHLGTDGVRKAASGLRALAESLGATFAFGRRFEGLRRRGGRVVGASVSGETIESGAVILAVGGSARDTFEILQAQGTAMEPKPFQLGLRLEHRQADLNRIQYGGGMDRWELPPAEVEFVVRIPHALSPVFTFCMCPGGMVIPAVSEPGHLSTNGMSESARDGPMGNTALVVTVPAERFGPGVLGGIALQRQVERSGFETGGADYTAPAQTVTAFLTGEEGRGPLETTFPFGGVRADLASILPDGIGEAIREALGRLGDRMPSYTAADAVLLGPETRGSCPVRLPRDSATLESISCSGLYPVGEGAGYAGGIVSAGVDGLRAALAVGNRFAPPS
ncbi:MAG: NAD(P)/FAD-dependent oxidoreductase, partial [Planctomycetota bacterium]